MNLSNKSVTHSVQSDRYSITMKNAHNQIVDVVNADTTATGMPNRAIEEEVAQLVPFYSNTHSNAILGNFATNEIEKIRDLVASELHVNRNEYDILFPGNGCTMAVKQLLHILGIYAHPAEWVVLISENEHHAVHLGVLQALSQQNCIFNLDQRNKVRQGKHDRMLIVPTIPGTNMINQHALADMLRSIVPLGYQILCFFNHTSNVTGSVQGEREVNAVIRSVAPTAIIAWDYACSFPYLEIDASQHDAVVMSPHKCMGGNGTPGLLIVRKSVHFSDTPFVMAGGITQYICESEQVLSFNQETLESAGSPNTLGILRLGPVLRYRRAHLAYINQRNLYLAQLLYKFVLTECKRLRPLDMIGQEGDDHEKLMLVRRRLPIISLVDRSEHPIHYNLYCAVLSDFFGIMTRGGLSCCTLLYQKYAPCCKDIALRDIFSGNGMPCSYGGIRVTLNYAMTDDEVNRVLGALKAVDQTIEYYAPLYHYEPQTNHYVLNV